ncbi:hypothetical protein ACLOJK_011296 [Asimina triloba]
MEAIKRRVVDSELVAFGILLHVKLGKLFGICRGGQPPFPGGSHKYLCHPDERAPRRPLVPVKRRAREEDRERNSKVDRRNAVAQGPAHVVLYVNEDGVGEEGAEEDAEHPPVEEGEPEAIVELIRTHCKNSAQTKTAALNLGACSHPSPGLGGVLPSHDGGYIDATDTDNVSSTMPRKACLALALCWPLATSPGTIHHFLVEYLVRVLAFPKPFCQERRKKQRGAKPKMGALSTKGAAL